MNDEWRLQIDIQDETHATPLVEHLDARELEHNLSEAFEDRVIVSRDGARLFVYAGTREQIDSAGEAIAAIAKREGWTTEARLRRWHPVAEDWENPDEPLPDGESAERSEHEALIAAEQVRSVRTGDAEFEVRVDLPSHGDAVDFAKRLRDEGLPVVRRWKYLLVGASDSDAAKALAERLKAEAPGGSEVAAEGTERVAWAERPPNPFAIFGGLGG